MENWINEPLTLSGKRVDLISLTTHHIPELVQLAKANVIWTHYIMNGANTKVLSEALHLGINEMSKGSQFAFVIYDKKEGKLAGSSRYLEINQEHKKLEIGWTWMHPDYWGTKVNFECKLLLLTHAFETLGTVRVQLRTDKLNLQSRRAIEKIGGKLEGTVRHDYIRDNGTHRDSVLYSILDNEWEAVKKGLIRKLEAG